MAKRFIVILCIFLFGCSVFPNTTTISAQSKAKSIDNPILKATQTFKWKEKK